MAQTTPPGQQHEQKEYDVGLAIGTTWHTPVDVSAKILQFVEAINFPIVGPERIADPGIGRTFGMYNPSLGKIECNGDITFSAATYGQIDWLFAQIMGADSEANSDTSAYTHSITISDEIWGHFFTLAYKFHGDEAVEFPSVKFNAWELTANPGEVAKVKFSGMADYAMINLTGSVAAQDQGFAVTIPVAAQTPAWEINQWIGCYMVVTGTTPTTGAIALGSSYRISANTATQLTVASVTGWVDGTSEVTTFYIGALNAGLAGGTFASTSAEDFGDRLHFDDLEVLIGTAGAGALTTLTDCFNVGAIKINFERPMQGDFRSSCSDANILAKHSIFEPRDTGVCKLTAEMSFPNYDDQTAYILGYWLRTAPASRRLEFNFLSPVLAGAATVYHAWELAMPAAFVSGQPTTLPLSGGMPVTVTFEATYFTGDVLPTLSIVNKNASTI